MDLKEYYGKIRETLEGLPDDFVIVVSRATTDGGKAGVLTEVSRQVAAKLVVDGRAHIATPEQAGAYYKTLQTAHQEMKAEEERGRNAAEIFSKAGMEALKKALGWSE